ncbi:MAG TPA: nucleotidyltransferase domain-containing protein [Leptospiraceae bacterium]|nr:nucleotidyltransferase domain-containing protein [Leptospiraceae bacterium]
MTTSNPILEKNLSPDAEKIISFCKKWKIREFYFFGSAVTEDFSPEKSDVDVMLDYAADSGISLFDLVKMKEELEVLFERKVDLVTKRGVENARNQTRKKSILEGIRIYYHE